METANAIWKALDPDAGGATSFDILRASDASGNELVLTSALCTADFANQAPYLIGDPATLHGVVLQDYALRWEGDMPPSVEAVASFCKVAMICVTDSAESLSAHLNAMGLEQLIKELPE